jgi:hypothetical protein
MYVHSYPYLFFIGLSVSEEIYTVPGDLLSFECLSINLSQSRISGEVYDDESPNRSLGRSMYGSILHLLSVFQFQNHRNRAKKEGKLLSRMASEAALRHALQFLENNEACRNEHQSSDSDLSDDDFEETVRVCVLHRLFSNAIYL